MTKRKGFVRSKENDESIPWDLPFHEENKSLAKETAFNFEPSEIKISEEEQAPLTLTAQDVENIRQSAMDEGLQQGKDAGFLAGEKEGFIAGKEQGFAQGREEGLKKGLQDGQESIASHCQHLEEMLLKLSEPLKQADKEVQNLMLDIIQQLTKAIVNVEIETNPKIIQQTLASVIDILPMHSQSLEVYLAPQDKEIIEGSFDKKKHNHKIRLIEKNQLSRGDIQVNCENSFVDFSMEQRIAEALARFVAKNARLNHDAKKSS